MKKRLLAVVVIVTFLFGTFAYAKEYDAKIPAEEMQVIDAEDIGISPIQNSEEDEVEEDVLEEFEEDFEESKETESEEIPEAAVPEEGEDYKEESEIKQFEEQNQRLTDAQKFVGSISGIMNPMTYVVVNSATIVLIYIGAIRVDAGNLTQGEVVALVNYMSQILVELVKLANLIISITKAIACGNRIQAVFNETSEMEEGDAVWENTEEMVRFNHVSLTYGGSKEESLSDISFSVKKGQTIGVIGGTGSGKTSLVNLIPRFYDATTGSIEISGKDIKAYKYEELRKKIGVVMQKAVLFKGTIEENLRWGNENASVEEFVDEKEGRLAFKVEQGGKNLSGGQKQRLTIARALVRKPEILILDDSASALDLATDRALTEAMKEMKDRPTTFIVSQRAASIRHADQILVMDDGALVGIGTHEELLETCETYQEIYYSQFPKEVTANE